MVLSPVGPLPSGISQLKVYSPPTLLLQLKKVASKGVTAPPMESWETVKQALQAVAKGTHVQSIPQTPGSLFR